MARGTRYTQPNPCKVRMPLVRSPQTPRYCECIPWCLWGGFPRLYGWRTTSNFQVLVSGSPRSEVRGPRSEVRGPRSGAGWLLGTEALRVAESKGSNVVVLASRRSNAAVTQCRSNAAVTQCRSNVVVLASRRSSFRPFQPAPRVCLRMQSWVPLPRVESKSIRWWIRRIGQRPLQERRAYVSSGRHPVRSACPCGAGRAAAERRAYVAAVR